MNKKRICIVAAAALFFLAGPASHAFAGIVGHWSFNEGAGAVTIDSSGHENHGTIIGAQWSSPGWDGQTGHCLLFDGKGTNRIDLGAFDAVGTGITIASWSKANNLDTPGNDPRLVSKANGGGGADHWWATGSCRVSNQKRIRFRLKIDGTTAEIQSGPAGTIELNEWIHIAATWDGATMRTYKNGVQVHTLAKAGKISVDPAVKVAIGNQPQGAEDRPWDGLIDEVIIADRAATASQVADLAKGIPPNWKKAMEPDPADGATGVTSPLFQWAAGETAVFHNVYLGATPELAEADLVANYLPLAMYFHLLPLEPGKTYYWRIDEVEADMKTVHPGDVWSFTTLPATAHDPQPENGAGFVPSEQVQLAWAAGVNALSHDVYFGDEAAAVAAGAAGTFQGNQTANTYSAGVLEKGKTYYWRVDQVVADGKVTGAVWSFTTIGPIAVVDPSLAGWWKFDEGGGRTAVDSSGHDRHGTLNGAPQWVEGRSGGALDFEFDNTHDCVVVPAFDIATSGMTLATWIKPESFSQGDGRIIDKGPDVASANDAWWMLSTVASGGQSRLRFRIKTDESANTTTLAATTGNIALGEWCHAAAIWDGTAMVLYKDGVEVGRVAKGGAAVAANAAAKVYLGNQLGGSGRRPWDGLIDDVRVYDRALSELEIGALAGK